MKISSFKKIIFCFFLLTLSFSCVSKKEVVYYQDATNKLKNTNTISYEIKIHPDDLLMITVGAEDAEVAAPFNLSTFNASSSVSQNFTGKEPNQLYLVDSEGDIDFPNIGKIRIGGYKRTEAIQMLQKQLSKFIKKPFVNLRVMNFKIAVQGEVSRPGIYNIESERVTFIEALSMANDLTIYGRRDNILLIREINGVKTYNRIDITKTNFINSPYYYLSQNDVIYVEPNKTKINDRGVGSKTGVILTAVSIFVSLATTLIVILK